MELLKKSILLLLVLGFAGSVAAQDLAMENAFAKSYAAEKKTDYTTAIAEIKAVYQESSYESNLRLGWLYYMATKHAESITYYTKASKLMPAATEPLWGLVNPLAAQEKWTDLEPVYKNILKLDPANSQAHYYIGLIYYYRKDYVTAKTHFDATLNLNPFDYSSMLMSGWNNYYLGKTTEAKALFHKVLMNNPNDKSALDALKLIN